MPTRSESIKKYLEFSTHKDLANLYHLGMECQVNVAQDGGERTDEEFEGRMWHGWTDGIQSWKSFRIPYNASSEPSFKDTEMTYDLAAHAEGIGMTGWDWQNRVSKWVGYDFDDLITHAEGLTNEELQDVEKTACALDWITVRKSTSGSGLHLYVFLDDVPTSNHNEHSALARAILGTMSAYTGFDFDSKVDKCGGNMWVWHRKMRNSPGLELIKKGSVFKDIPLNWKDHIKVVTGQRRKTLPQIIEDNKTEDKFLELCGQRPTINLDSDHRQLIDWLKINDALWWWEQDNHMLVTHTHYLKRAHVELEFKGVFETISAGSNLNEQNCFLYPLRRGAWKVCRYSQGIKEHDSWNQDSSGWTNCYLNQEADLATASRTFGAVEHSKGGFIFREAEIAQKATEILGIKMNIAPFVASRELTLTKRKDGRLQAEVEHKPTDLADGMSEWHVERGKWINIFNVNLPNNDEPGTDNYDDLVRHLVTNDHTDQGWMLCAENIWRVEPKEHIKLALGAMGHSNKDVALIMGIGIPRAWRVVNKPFQPEYPGNREWNMNAAQLKFIPNKRRDRHYPKWTSILDHCGSGLNDAIKEDSWCKANGLLTGGEYLKCWIASVFQEPEEPLPYLFFYGPQNSGKSIFHEALDLLLTKGYQRADSTLITQSTFNGELEGKIICVVEETDLRINKNAYNRIKDWVTSRHLNIHHKNRTPYHTTNTTHWIQCSNDHQACPIFAGDTRITMCYVDSLDPMDLIPKKKLIPILILVIKRLLNK